MGKHANDDLINGLIFATQSATNDREVLLAWRGEFSLDRMEILDQYGITTGARNILALESKIFKQKYADFKKN